MDLPAAAKGWFSAIVAPKLDRIKILKTAVFAHMMVTACPPCQWADGRGESRFSERVLSRKNDEEGGTLKKAPRGVIPTLLDSKA